jgi:sensor histidine kinase YesM
MLAFWVSNFVLLSFGQILAGSGGADRITLQRLLPTMIGLIFCLLMFPMLRQHRLSTARKRLIALAVVVPFATETYTWATYFAHPAVYASFGLEDLSWRIAARIITFWSWFCLACAGLYLAVAYSLDVREEQQRTADISERAHAAQLRALHSQINPHFLFNSLNSVSALILDGDAARADEMVTKLARFLRLGLAADPMERILLPDEIELQRIYLEIEQLRFEDLEIAISIPEQLASATVPALILQTIVENAVKYGVAGAPPPARISITAWDDGPDLVLQVEDSGNAGTKAPGGAGIGLSNVLQRLQLAYGATNVSLMAGRQPDGAFRVRLQFPLEVQ